MLRQCLRPMARTMKTALVRCLVRQCCWVRTFLRMPPFHTLGLGKCRRRTFQFHRQQMRSGLGQTPLLQVTMGLLKDKQAYASRLASVRPGSITAFLGCRRNSLRLVVKRFREVGDKAGYANRAQHKYAHMLEKFLAAHFFCQNLLYFFKIHFCSPFYFSYAYIA